MNKNLVSCDKLNRGLKERHIQLIAFGGTIGVGLFYGSSAAIKSAGPSLIIMYLLIATFIFFVMRALGELAVSKPVAGSFATYAYEEIGPLAGFLTGWSYWIMWIVACMAEITAAGVYMQYWFPNIAQWIFALFSLISMTIVNMITVRLYGEFEFWFALIKIVTIILMLIMGTVLIIFGIGNNGVPIGISNLWSFGGFFPNGIDGMIHSLNIVVFAYLGVELIGVTAGEAQNPKKTIPSAINKVFWRVLIFYIASLFVIMSLYPWSKICEMGSPFVITFAKLGIKQAAGIINFVVLTAALSACNGGVFSTGRMLYGLSEKKEAPSIFYKLNKNHVPVTALLFSAILMLIGVFLNYIMPAKAFHIIISLATTYVLFTWGIILVSHLNKRKKFVKNHPGKKPTFAMPFYPISNYGCLLIIAFVLGAMLYYPDTRLSGLLAPIWFIILYIVYKVKYEKNRTNGY